MDDKWIYTTHVLQPFSSNVLMCGYPKNKESADAEGPCNAPQIQNITLEKGYNTGTTFKDTQGHYNCSY